MHSHRDGYLNALGEAPALRAHRQQRAYLSTRPMLHCNGRGPAGGRDRAGHVAASSIGRPVLGHELAGHQHAADGDHRRPA